MNLKTSCPQPSLELGTRLAGSQLGRHTSCKKCWKSKDQSFVNMRRFQRRHLTPSPSAQPPPGWCLPPRCSPRCSSRQSCASSRLSAWCRQCPEMIMPDQNLLEFLRRKNVPVLPRTGHRRFSSWSRRRASCQASFVPASSAEKKHIGSFYTFWGIKWNKTPKYSGNRWVQSVSGLLLGSQISIACKAGLGAKKIVCKNLIISWKPFANVE